MQIVTLGREHLAAACALLSRAFPYDRIDRVAEEKLFDRARELAPFWEQALHSLKGARHVIDVRNLGLVGGIELEPRPGAAGRRAMEAHIRCFEAGALVRFTGDILALSPPLIIDRPQVEQLVQTIRDALQAIA